MAKKVPKNPVLSKLDEIATAVENLFILQALSAGMDVETVRAILKVDQWRVSRISKPLKQAQRRSSRG